MSPVLIRLENDHQFSEPVPASLPVGEPVPMTRTAVHHDIATQNVSGGFWECSPGRLRRAVMQAEFSYFIEGKGSFTPDGGEPIHFKAGDSIYFAAETHGEWEIVETVRKTYFILG
ncbi:cupin domain-containing protein [Pseudomonas sp. BJa5]|uniref:cupin domain-containing protein n=1 Tax=Pseudomonas sp. BJa5 TaxID=2936270 RepID=UPI002559FE3D|nr:cupin domain-containing protein [Pseudomonas sp. BGr12]MDL2422879.1 cupin domain-containing protein [Pseudomonas sp. BGr12]